MISMRNRAVTSRFMFSVALLFALVGVSARTHAKPDKTKIHSFWVAGASSVTVKADQAILIMVIRGTSSDVAGALAENHRITSQAYDVLTDLRLQGKFRLTEMQVGSGEPLLLSQRSFMASNPGRPLPYSYPLRTSPSCYEVRSYVLVTFDGDDLARLDFDQTLANTIDRLTRAGAYQPERSPQLPQFHTTGPVLFTVKDPTPALQKAVGQAMAQAKALAQEVASNSGVKLDRILDARVNRPLEVTLPRREELNVADELHLQYYSTSKDAVTIPATFAVQYSTK